MSTQKHGINVQYFYDSVTYLQYNNTLWILLTIDVYGFDIFLNVNFCKFYRYIRHGLAIAQQSESIKLSDPKHEGNILFKITF